MPTLDERIRQEIGDLVVKVHALNSEIERLNELLDREKLKNSGLSTQEILDVPKQKTRQKTNSQDKAGDSAQT